MPAEPGASAATAQSWLTLGMDRVGFLQHELFGQPLWKYVASVVYILLAFYSSKLIDWLLANQLRQWTRKTQTEFDDLLLETVRGPIKVVGFVILLHVGLRLFTWPSWVQEYLSKGLRLVVAWSLTYMVLKAIKIFLTYWQKRLSTQEDRVLDDQLFPLIRKLLSAAILIVAVLLTCDNLGIKITSILAGLSVGGLALGLAAQDTVANLFGAVAIFMDKPFRLGDRIQIESVDGTVESIGLRSTRVRNLDGHMVTIPNKTMGNTTITNVSKRPTIKTVIDLGLVYDTSLPQMQRALTILEDIFRPYPRTADVVIGFDQFGDSALNIKVVHWWKGTDWKAYMADLQELNLRILERFNKERLSMAYPTQTLYVKSDVPASPSDDRSCGPRA